tara:strand:- start:331 stop:483 length:153 start_codon:yes stop_codon:yes gene_type:complete
MNLPPLSKEMVEVLIAASKKQKNNGSNRARRRAMERALEKYEKYYGNESS